MSYVPVHVEELIPPPAEINDSHKDNSVVIAVIILGIVSSLTVFARLGQRYVSRNFGADDWAMIPAVLLYIGWTAMSAYFNFHSGIGKPIGDITYGEFILFYQGVFIAAWMYPAMSGAIRISILFFYRRLFAKASTFYRNATWVLIAMQAAYIITFEIIPGFSCTPIADGWEPVRRLTSCTDLYIDATIGLYSVSLAFDVILLVFPLWIVFRLQMPIKKRIGVSVIFLIGTCASIAAAYKLGIFVQQSSDFTAPDVSWWYYQASAYMPPQYNAYGRIFWIPTQVEPAVALIGTSLPAMLQLYSAASLQFSKMRSARSSDRKEEEEEDGKPTVGLSMENLRPRKPTSLEEGKVYGGNPHDFELRTVSSQPSSRTETV